MLKWHGYMWPHLPDILKANPGYKLMALQSSPFMLCHADMNLKYDTDLIDHPVIADVLTAWRLQSRHWTEEADDKPTLKRKAGH